MLRKSVAAVCTFGGPPLSARRCSSCAFTASETACVSAAEPERQTRRWLSTAVILSETRLAMYAPVDVRESAPNTTPPSKVTAMIDVPRSTSPSLRNSCGSSYAEPARDAPEGRPPSITRLQKEGVVSCAVGGGGRRRGSAMRRGARWVEQFAINEV